MDETRLIFVSLMNIEDNIKHGWFWSCVITTLKYTGIRRRQLVGLTWSDFDIVSPV
jgi:integrase